MGIVYPKNLGIPVRVGARAILGRPENDVGTGGDVDYIAIAANIVCCVVDGELFG